MGAEATAVCARNEALRVVAHRVSRCAEADTPVGGVSEHANGSIVLR
jgi:hypothetical protein